MKTLIFACFSCVTLTGVYFAMTNRSAISKLLSANRHEAPAYTTVMIAASHTSIAAGETETATNMVQTIPAANNNFTISHAVNTADVQAESAVATTASTATGSNDNWFDYSAFQLDAAAPEATTTAPKPEAPVTAEPVVIEEENKPAVEVIAEEEVATPSNLAARHLNVKLHRSPVDSIARYTAPKQVSANSIARHTVATAEDKMIVTPAVAESEEMSKVTYAPSNLVATQAEAGRESYSYSVLYDRAERIKAYAVRKGYDTSFAFMIDMGMKSGKKRFFVMDLNTMTIVKRGMVAHGRGNSSFTFNKSYSNTSGSNCTSLGIYKVGAQYKGTYGTSYKLMGLENTNNNAYKRSIILHGLNCIPYDESEFPICQSEGCPSLAPAFLKEIAPIINSRSKPILLWIYDPVAENIEEEMVVNY